MSIHIVISLASNRLLRIPRYTKRRNLVVITSNMFLKYIDNLLDQQFG